jgi:hypothetical protein
MQRSLGRRVVLALALIACDDGSGAPGPRIDRVAPDPVLPGTTLGIHGEGFGDEPGARDGAALGGRPLPTLAWGSARLLFEVPADVPAGAALLVLHAGGRPLEPWPVTVGGDGRFPASPTAPAPSTAGADAFPDPADGGPTPNTDAARFPDVRLPDATLQGAKATFTPDDLPAVGTVLVAVESPPGTLTLEARASPGLWGQGFHLTYDPNLLQFVSAAPEPDLAGAARHWSLPTPGRLLYGGLDPGAGEAVLRVRFAVIGAGEGRVDLPARTASARAAGNRPVADWPFVGGSVRVEVEP